MFTTMGLDWTDEEKRELEEHREKLHILTLLQKYAEKKKMNVHYADIAYAIYKKRKNDAVENADPNADTNKIKEDYQKQAVTDEFLRAYLDDANEIIVGIVKESLTPQIEKIKAYKQEELEEVAKKAATGVTTKIEDAHKKYARITNKVADSAIQKALGKINSATDKSSKKIPDAATAGVNAAVEKMSDMISKVDEKLEKVADGSALKVTDKINVVKSQLEDNLEKSAEKGADKFSKNSRTSFWIGFLSSFAVWLLTTIFFSTCTTDKIVSNVFDKMNSQNSTQMDTAQQNDTIPNTYKEVATPSTAKNNNPAPSPATPNKK